MHDNVIMKGIDCILQLPGLKSEASATSTPQFLIFSYGAYWDFPKKKSRAR